MDPSSSTPVVPVAVGVPPAQTQTPNQGVPGLDLDLMQENQNDRPSMAPTTVDKVHRTSVPQQQQPVQRYSRPPNLCCCCRLKVGLRVMASFDVVVQIITVIIFSVAAYDLNGREKCPGRRPGAFNCDAFYTAVVVFLALSLLSSIILLISTCMMQKTVSVVSHVVGWILTLSSVIYSLVYVHYDSSGPIALYTAIGIIVGFSWRIYESVVVYYYWKDLRPSASQIRENFRNAAATATAPPPNYYAQRPGYGVYGQPGGYSNYNNSGVGGYGGFGQPGYGGQ